MSFHRRQNRSCTLRLLQIDRIKCSHDCFDKLPSLSTHLEFFALFNKALMKMKKIIEKIIKEKNE